MTSKFKTLDPTNLKSLRSEVNEALESVCKKYGIDIEIGNLKYNSKSAHGKITFAIKDPSTGVGMGKEAQDYLRFSSMYNLKPEWLGKVFSYGGKNYRIVGLNTRRAFGKNPKYPVFIDNLSNGARLKCAPSMVLSGKFFEE